MSDDPSKKVLRFNIEIVYGPADDLIGAGPKDNIIPKDLIIPEITEALTELIKLKIPKESFCIGTIFCLSNKSEPPLPLDSNWETVNDNDSPFK